MVRTKIRSSIVLAAAVAIVATMGSPARSEVPTNDLLENATTIDAVPFTASQDATDAHADGPRLCANNGSVFYRFRPTEDVFVQIDTLGSEYDTKLAVLRGSRNDLRVVRCNDDALGLASAVRFRARAGVRYFVMVAQCCRFGRDGAGPLSLTVTEVPTDPFTLEVTATGGTIDLIGGEVELEGTVACSHRATGYAEGRLRQRRGDLYVATAWFGFRYDCLNDGSDPWTATVEGGDIGFAAGDARVRLWFDASDGFDGTSGEVREVVTLT